MDVDLVRSSQWEDGKDAMDVAGAPVMNACFTSMPIQLDGRLTEAAWREAPAYSLHLPASRIREGERMQEGGIVRFLWDEQYFYAGVQLQDSDLVAEGGGSNVPHNGTGDACELFLKPDDCTWYWELHVTPAGEQASFFIPGRGRLGLPSMFAYNCGLKVAAHCDGTINDWTDRDQGWSAEIAMPIADLTARGERFGPGASWSILVGRYNYSRFLLTRGPELSSTPQLSGPDFHRYEEFASLKLIR